ncbi:MAG TPA: hypothetical protein VG603_09555 [Chitinophagales bacterium]|nr:hypothetical protein [Chitinophagales bacterium]
MRKSNIILKGAALFTLLLIMASPAYAGYRWRQQGDAPPPPNDRIEALRVAYITQQLNLTPEEAQKFWPVYNAYRSDLKTLMQNFRPVNGQAPTADQQLDFEQKKLDLKKKYKPQFEAALGTEKLNQLYNLEHKFQEKLKEIRDQRMQQRVQPGNTPAPHPAPMR